tara:strand:- start:658 stop:1200 length:543 start_codon:yes stop_codon:yes gene_type:complete
MLSLFIYDGVTPLGWKSKIQENSASSLFYRISPLFYSVSGIIVLLLNKTLKAHDNFFWWNLFGIMLILQGICSYMSDVEYWGKNSYWEYIDSFLATTLTLIGGPVVIFRTLSGYANYPLLFTLLWSLSVSFSLYCKYMSNLSLKTLNPSDYLFWHSLWHCLPLYAIFIILFLHYYDSCRI